MRLIYICIYIYIYNFLREMWTAKYVTLNWRQRVTGSVPFSQSD